MAKTTITINVQFPKMPKMKDFQGVTEDPDWIAHQYEKALKVWAKVCDQASRDLGAALESV